MEAEERLRRTVRDKNRSGLQNWLRIASKV